MSNALGPVRRIVTGHDEEGKAVIVSDGPPPVVINNFAQAGLVFSELWNTGSAPAQIDRHVDPTSGSHGFAHPSYGGTVVRFVDFPPENENGEISNDGAEKVLSKVSLQQAKSKFSKNRHPLMHRTETIDYAIVVSGEVTLLLDDSEVTVRAGDVVIQCGTIHAWANRSAKFCRIAFVLVDGRYEVGLSADLAD